MFVFDEIYKEIVREFENADKEVLFVSPYITSKIVEIITSAKKNNEKLTYRLVTLPPGIEYVNGATDPKALLTLSEAGFRIRMLERLHAKVYLFDQKIMYLGSANFTSNGFGLNKLSNEEILLKQQISQNQAKLLSKQFWDEAIPVKITEEWFNEVEDYIQSLDFPKEKYQQMNRDIFNRITIPEPSNPYELFLKKLKNKGDISS
jgi:hypothetical protein